MLKQLIKSSLERAGWELHRVPVPGISRMQVTPAQDRIHYACGYVYHDGWLNVDIIKDGPPNYLYMNLVDRHPFPDNHFQFALCEDFIEHVTQADSLIFLAEVYRTLRPGGVLRVTFPSFEGVLGEHFSRPDFDTYATGRTEAYAKLGHVHFYSRDSLALAARNIGYQLEFVSPNRSKHLELANMNSRLDPVNLHAELTKPLN